MTAEAAAAVEAPEEGAAAPAEQTQAAPEAPATAVGDAAGKAAAEAAPADPKPYWPEDWVKQAAKGDDKRMGRLSRYASPEAMADALIEAQDKIRSGGLRVPFPADGDETAQNNWRKENGIPESFDKYEIKLDDDMVIGEGDKQMFESFLKEAHAENLSPSAVNKLASWYFKNQENAFNEQSKFDDTSMREFKKSLMEEWGGGYEANLDEIGNYLVANYGSEVASQLHLARLPDGRLLGNVPEIARAWLKQSRELNPGAVLVPGASNQAAAVSDRITQIKGIMRDNPDQYWGDKKMQDEFQKLLEYEEKKSNAP